jgi:tetratricopeptide (TPR) repeat protein
LQIDDQPPTRRSLGSRYFYLSQYDKAIPELEKALEMYKKWGMKPLGHDFYSFLGAAYHKTGQYKKEKKLYKKAEQDFPDNRYLTYRQAILALTEKDTITANRFIEKFKSMLKDNSVSEAVIAASLGDLYAEAGIFDKAEEYYRKPREIAPQDVRWQGVLATFLINNDRNINEGMELVDKALTSSPDNFNFLHIKGLGLYKQGKYQEALEVLQKSWDLRTKNAYYDHEAFLHLQEAKKAMEGKK